MNSFKLITDPALEALYNEVVGSLEASSPTDELMAELERVLNLENAEQFKQNS